MAHGTRAGGQPTTVPNQSAAGLVPAGPITPGPPPPALPGAQGLLTGIRRGPLWHLDSGGDGEAVVLLHPGVGDLRLWAHPARALADAGYRVVAYDRPGHGRSPASAAGAAAGPEADLDDLDDVAAGLRLGRFHLVGAAQGARIAAGFARRRPQDLRSLVLASATLFTAYASAGRPAGAPASLPPGFTALPAWFRELGPAYRQADPEGVRRWLEITGPDGAAGRDGGSGTVSPPGPAPAPAPGGGDPAGGFPGPGLALTGDADPFAPPPACRAYAAGRSGWEFSIIPESGHSPFWERPDLFSGVLLGFLRGAR